MEQQNDMLSALLSDPEKLQNAIQMASSILGGGAQNASPPMAVPNGDTPPEQPNQSPNPSENIASAPPPAENSTNFSPPSMNAEPAAAENFHSFVPPTAPAGGFSGFFSPPPKSSHDSNNYDPSAELLSKAIPIIQAIARSSAKSVNHDKVNLLNSLKPFTTTNITGQLDHAIRLVSMARMARNIMGQLTGSLGGGDGTLNL